MPSRVYKDTVEEFWDWGDIETCYAKADLDSSLHFTQRLRSFLGCGCGRIFLTPSARWGVEHFLRGLAGGGSGTILMPAFTCSVVRTAAEKAGFAVEGYDFTSPTGTIDWVNTMQRLSQLTNKAHPIVLMVTHLFGVPVDFSPVVEFCRDMGVYVVEDCAHTLGGKINGVMAGTLSDAAVFSFNYDKPISLGWGGALVINNQELMDKFSFFAIPVPNAKQELKYLKAFVESMAHRRRNIGNEGSLIGKIMRRLQMKSSGFEFPLLGVGPLRGQLGLLLLERYLDVRDVRNRNAAFVAENLPRERTWDVGPTVQPAWLKQKVLMNTERGAQKVSSRLQKKGYRVGNFNWPTLLPGMRDADVFANGTRSATCALDIPVHQNMSQDDLEFIVSSLNE